MTLLSIALTNLRSRAVRTFATIFSVMLAVASFVALIALANGVEKSLIAALDVRQTDAVVTEKGAVDLISSIVSEGLADRIKQVEGVADAAAELTRMTSLESGGSAVVVAWQPGAYPWNTLVLSKGRLASPRDDNVAVVGEAFALRNNLDVGASLVLFQTEFQVIGIASSDSLLTNNLVMVPLRTAQRLTFRDGQATAINVRLSSELPASGKQFVVERLRAALPEQAVDGTEALASGHTFARIANVLSRSIAIVALLSAVFAILNTMSMAVRERRGEIAIMNAIGWPRRRIVGLIVLEASAMAGLGGLLGCALGAVVAYVVSHWDSVSGIVEPAVSLQLLAQGALLSILIGLAGAVLPALQTTSLSPADVLRGK